MTGNAMSDMIELIILRESVSRSRELSQVIMPPIHAMDTTL